MLSPLSAAVVISDRTLREEAIACIDNLPVRIVCDLRLLDDVEDLLDRIERYRVDVLLLEGSLLSTPLEEFARRLKMTSSEPVIFLLNNQAVAANILEAMQAGAREYLCPPLTTPLKEAFDRLSGVRNDQVAVRQNKLGRSYGFISAKGGCGATTFASHVAALGARSAEKPVLLADLDFEAGLQRFIFKAKPRYSLRDAVENMHRMDSSYWNALVSGIGDKLEFIAAPEELSERGNPDPRQVARLLRFIRTTYQVSIVDFGRWYSAAALDSLPEMEVLFVVVTQDLLVLENAREIIRMAEERGKSFSRIKILLNRVPARAKPDPAGVESYLGMRPAGVFSDDAEALYESWSEGRMLGNDSTLCRQLTELAKSVVVQESTEPSATPPRAETPAGGLGRFLPFMRRSRA